MSGNVWRVFIARTLLFLTPQALTPFLESQLKGIAPDSIIVYPENGALPVRNMLGKQKVPTVSVKVYRPAGRLNDRAIGKADELLALIDQRRPRAIEVVDDVMVTGATTRAIKEYIEAFFTTRFDVNANTWLLSAPKRTESKSGIDGVNILRSSFLYGSQNGSTVPTNSLSTWIFDDEKGQTVVESYARKYAKSNEFISFIQKLRSQRR